MPSLRLAVLSGRFAVCRLPADAAVPAWADAGGFVSVTRTAHELSVLCAEERVPADVRSEAGFRALMLEGPFDFSAVGILASVASPLAEGGVSLFAVSTFDTDYVLVKDERLADALRVLAAAGHAISLPS